jgi:gliding motility-associated-like protein
VLTASGAGSYTWSAGATPTGATTASASPATTTTYTVTGTSAGCTGTAVATVTVNSVADATITPVSPVCLGAAPFTLTAAQGGGTWSGTGITNASAGTFEPAVAGVGSYVINYSITGACAGSDTVTITVINNQNSTITPVLPVCLGSLPFNFSAATSGGTWSGTGITNGSTGQFTPAAAGTGTFIITYSIAGSCGSTDTTLITVNPNSDATITQPGPQCAGGPTITLSAASSGGFWSGPGVTTGTSGVFDPGAAGIGTHIITYSIGGSCGSSDTVSITVNATANSTINPVSSPCISAAPITLTAATGGGVWSGPGITDAVNGTFDPSITSIGTQIITYTLTGSCASSDTLAINVTGLPDVTIAPAGPFCPGSPAITLVAATSGGGWFGPGTSGSTFDPSVAGIGLHVITYSIPGACGNIDTSIIEVVAPVSAAITAVAPVCAGSPSFLFSGSPSGGTWSGTATDPGTGSFDPSVSGAGTFVITYSIPGGCGDTTTFSMTVNPLPSPSVSSDLPGGCAPACITFTETGSASCNTVSFDYGDGSSSSSGTHCYTAAGIYDVTVTCTDINGCTGSSIIPSMISVSAAPSASFTFNPPGVSPANTTISFLNTSSGGGNSVWNFGDVLSGPDNTSITTDPSHLYESEGQFCITLVETNSAGCADTVVNCLVIANEATVVVPNVFTPNGDGDNDMFLFRTTSVNDLSCAVYDRWGLKMAEWNSVQGGWDGRTSSGNMAPDGVYYYMLKATATNGKVIEKQGFVQLLNR